MTISDLFLENVQVSSQAPRKKTEHTVLLVDDEPKVLSALERAFRQESYRILKASGAAEALDIMQEEAVEVVISDHRMPGMTGAELLTTVRTRWPETIRIMLTGYADVQSIMGAVNEGAVYKFMTKPWLDDDLRVTVARALEQYDLQKEVRSLREENHRHEERLQEFSALFAQERGLSLKMLLREELIPPEQRDAIFEEHQRTSELMYRLVLSESDLSEDQVAQTLQDALGMEVLDLREVRVSPEAASLIPPDFCRDNLLLPVRLADNMLTIVMADPSDILKRENLESLLGLRLNVLISKGSDIEQKINEAYGQALTQTDEAVGALDEIDIVIEETEQDEDVEGMLRNSVVPPVVRIVNAILAEAIRRRASDIHIEPRVKSTVVRYRIDGLLQDRMELPCHLHSGVSSRLKVLAKMDIAEKRRPQDGRITVRAPERMVDLRVSSLPTMHGENIVLRVLDRGGVVRRIRDLGLCEDNLHRVRSVGRKPQGIVICTGPTGSGKTTMLYVGKLLFAQSCPDHYRRVLEAARVEQQPLHLVEARTLGLDHGRAGARLAGHWKLPQYLCSIIAGHHQNPRNGPTSPEAVSMARTVRLADALVRTCQIGTSGNTCLRHDAFTHISDCPPVNLDVRHLLSELPGRIRRAELHLDIDGSNHSCPPDDRFAEGRVLLLVDDVDARSLLTVTLLNMGYECVDTEQLSTTSTSDVSALIHDQPVPCSTRLICDDGAATKLDYSRWKQEHLCTEAYVVPIDSLRSWLTQSLRPCVAEPVA